VDLPYTIHSGIVWAQCSHTGLSQRAGSQSRGLSLFRQNCPFKLQDKISTDVFCGSQGHAASREQVSNAMAFTMLLVPLCLESAQEQGSTVGASARIEAISFG
jgi:hypothetical protein